MQAKYYLIAIFVLGVGLPGPVFSQEIKASEAEELEKILSETLDDSEYVDEKRCLRSHEYQKVDILDSGHLVFRGRKDKIWLNSLRNNCSGLRKGLILQFQMHGRRVCRMDFFQGLQSFSDRNRPTATCVLGAFEQVTQEQLALLEESLAKQKNNKVVRSTKKAARAAKEKK